MELIIALLILESIVLESESSVGRPLLLQIHRRLPDGLLQLAIGMPIELSFLGWSWVSLVGCWAPGGPQVYLASP